jgi:hypothetical protein
MRNVSKVFVRIPEGKRPLGRQSGWENNIRMSLRETE